MHRCDGKHSMVSSLDSRLYDLEVYRWKTNAVARLPEGAVEGISRLVWVVLMSEQIRNN